MEAQIRADTMSSLMLPGWASNGANLGVIYPTFTLGDPCVPRHLLGVVEPFDFI